MSAPYAPPPGPPPVPTVVRPTTRPRGKRTMIAGFVIMVVAAVAIAASIAAWFIFGRTSTDGAELVSMPGSFSKELTEGEWAFYTEYVDGTGQVTRVDDVTIEGPGEVTKESTTGFFSDTTTIDFEGTEYEVFMRLDVPADGTYDFDIARTDSEEVQIVIGQYPDHDLLATVVVWTVVVSVPLGTIGFIVLLIGLIMWLTGRGKNTPPPLAAYPTYPPA